ncbi:MAG: DUF4342 domain-containing protein [Cyclonatronaceae bacterium]
MAHDVFEEFRTSGRELVDKAREILQEGNVRRMIIKNSDNETLLEVPLTLGVIGVGGAFALAPILSGIATFAFFVQDARILVERYPGGGSGPRKKRKGKGNPLENELTNDEHSPPAGSENRGKDARHTDPYEIDARFEVIR